SHLGISASTASNLVRRLLDAGTIREVIDGPSTGGRRAARPQVVRNDAAWLLAQPGGGPPPLGIRTRRETLRRLRETRVDVSGGPAATIAALRESLDALVADLPDLRLLSAAIALPGPVSSLTGELIAPARMPGWHGTRVVDEFEESLGL